MLDKNLYQRIRKMKKQLDRKRPFPKTILRKLKEQMILEWTYNSNAIEGNTLNLRETELILNYGITIAGKSLHEHFEVTNHKEAIELVEKLIKRREKLNEGNINRIHEIILTKIDPRHRGTYRKEQVRILGSPHIPPSPLKIPKLMKEFTRWLNKNPEKLNPLELAALAHYKLAAIHPYLDGNGRTARLIMNFILIRKGYPPAVILNNDRKKYYRVLSQADLGNFKPLVEFIARAAERSLALYLQAIEKTTSEKEYLTLKEASLKCPYSQEYLSLLARQGKIPALKFQRNWMISRKDLKKYLSCRRS